MIFKTACKCDRDREAKEKERQKQLEIERLKSICFTSIIQWAYTFENYQGICADCGGKLSYREPAEHKEKKYDSDYSFVCQHYRHRKGTCSMHYIKVKTINEILLKSIKEITDFVKEEKEKKENNKLMCTLTL